MPKSLKIEYNSEKCLNILNTLYDILKIDIDNSSFSLYDLDNDINAQISILGLSELCKSNYATSSWTYFRYLNENKEAPRPYLLLIRNILDAHKVTYFNKRTTFMLKNKQISTTKYFILKQ
jgi:hypothetical protein